MNFLTFFRQIEEQVQAMTFGDETGDYSSLFNGNFQSIDSKQFNNKLNIEETYAEISGDGNNIHESQNESLKNLSPEYATVDMNKKREARREKLLKLCESSATNDLNKPGAIIYEDVVNDDKIINEESNIYELVRFINEEPLTNG